MSAEVLVVDDDLSVRRSLVKLLTAHGYRPTPVASGAAAIENATHSPPDVVLMDLQMPTMSGIDAARAFKADPALAHVPILAMSAKPPPGEFEPLFASFLLKPMTSAELLRAIEHALRR